MTNPHMNLSGSNILVVDDIPENLKLMTSILKQSGYKVRSVASGAMALETAKLMPPDLILLDINMPEMDGYEVCSRLKTDAELAPIPVIFLSALSECPDKVQGFQVGGIDYITKPFQAEEVLARIEGQLELSRLRKELQKQNEILEEKVHLRTRELAEAKDRLAILDKTKGDFLSLISHELRTPLNGIFGIAELIFDSCQLTADEKDLLRHYEFSRQRIISILDDALLLTQIGMQSEQFANMPVSLAHALRLAIRKAGDPTKMPRASFGTVPEFPAPIYGDPEMVEKALAGFLEAADKFSVPGSVLELSGLTSESEVVLGIKATGYRIPEASISKIFDVLAIAESITPGGDLGLKLPLSERIVKLMGGAVEIKNTEPPGVSLTIRFSRFLDPQI